MIGLTEVQKEILVFLLVAAIISGLICLFSYIIWRKCCIKQIKRNLEKRADNSAEENDEFPVDPFDAETLDYSWTGHPSNERSQNNQRLPRNSAHPTAPSLDIFGFHNERSSTTASSPTTAVSTISGSPMHVTRSLLEDASGVEYVPNETNGQGNHADDLPTYEELMQQRLTAMRSRIV
ncbi:uncharacterized protein LOC143450088 [Clavelina lepadiformis]|uniref:uncharacterized protein LOC143450088 n=1 Tax=Clavelina lepadiformis TaxID=159417 RepID=UPI00404287D1